MPDDVSPPKLWYSEGELLQHPSGAVYRAERNSAGRLEWVLIQEPPA